DIINDLSTGGLPFHSLKHAGSPSDHTFSIGFEHLSIKRKEPVAFTESQAFSLFIIRIFLIPLPKLFGIENDFYRFGFGDGSVPLNPIGSIGIMFSFIIGSLRNAQF